jgi:hypothetical protein
MEIVSLYNAEIIDLGKAKLHKIGITEDYHSRGVTYSKGGRKVKFHFVAIPRPGLSSVIKTIENDMKIELSPYFEKFNSINSTEYIDPKKHKHMTLKNIEKITREHIAKYPGRIFIVKKKWLPLTLNTLDLKDFVQNALKYPDKYLEGF